MSKLRGDEQSRKIIEQIIQITKTKDFSTGGMLIEIEKVIEQSQQGAVEQQPIACNVCGILAFSVDGKYCMNGHPLKEQPRDNRCRKIV